MRIQPIDMALAIVYDTCLHCGKLVMKGRYYCSPKCEKANADYDNTRMKAQMERAGIVV